MKIQITKKTIAVLSGILAMALDVTGIASAASCSHDDVVNKIHGCTAADGSSADGVVFQKNPSIAEVILKKGGGALIVGLKAGGRNAGACRAKDNNAADRTAVTVRTPDCVDVVRSVVAAQSTPF